MVKNTKKLIFCTMFFFSFTLSLPVLAMEQRPGLWGKMWNGITKFFIIPERNKNKRFREISESPKPRKKQKLESGEREAIISLEQISSLNQIDDWRCGYFSVYNGCQMLKAAKSGELQEICKNLKDLNLKTKEIELEFKNFLDTMSNKPLIKKYASKAWLDSDYIKILLTEYFKVKSFEELEDITVFDIKYDEHFKSKPFCRVIGKYINRNVDRFRKESVPQLILINNKHHWFANLLTKDGIWRADSLYENSKILPIEEEIFKYFSN